jgi:D-glucosaminate-6-phosphate ammonia-lyase
MSPTTAGRTCSRFDDIIEVARARRVPVIVDGAAEDIRGIRDLIARGADLIATSGGKALRGPAASGVLAGRRELIRAATLQQQDMHVHPDR